MTNRNEIVGGVYHVINRGAGSRFIFYNEVYKSLFTSILEHTAKLYNLTIFAFCVMGNHYHLLIQLNDENLSKAIQYLNSTYARSYNILRKKDGPVFRGRFKSIYVKNIRYYLTVSRYIHRNPVSAGAVTRPEFYYWSSYCDYIYPEKRFPWVTVYYHSSDPYSYRDFVNKGNNERITEFYKKPAKHSVL